MMQKKRPMQGKSISAALNVNAGTAGHARIVGLTLAGGMVYAVNVGIHSNYGILLGAITQSSGVSYASVSFVLAVAQLMYGIAQPLFGVVAMRRSTLFALSCGAVLTAAGLLLIPLCTSLWALLLCLGILLPAGLGALAFGLVMGVITPQVPQRQIGVVSGIVTASSGIGNSVLSPAIQAMLAAAGLMGAMVFLSVPTLFLLPVCVWMCRSGAVAAQGTAQPKVRMKDLFTEALHSRTYLCLIAGFFTCGFHMAIIETHLYTQFTSYGIADKSAALAFSVYGVATILGAILSGALCSRFRMKQVLTALYSLRAVAAVLFFLAPKTLLSVFAFAAFLGVTGNATVPPTSGLVERTFGAAKLGTLFGFVFFCHQIGSFFSAWLGGVCADATDGYALIWTADILLCALAAVASFVIREEKR